VDQVRWGCTAKGSTICLGLTTEDWSHAGSLLQSKASYVDRTSADRGVPMSNAPGDDGKVTSVEAARQFSWLRDLSPIAENIAKYGGAIGVIALGVALIYDIVFWWLIDPRMLSYLVLADHIQTAIQMFGFICFGVVIGALFSLIASNSLFKIASLDRTWKIVAALAIVTGCIVCIVWVASADVGLTRENRAAVIMSAVGLLVMLAWSVRMSRRRPLWVSPKAFLAALSWPIVPMVVIFTIGLAVSLSFGTARIRDKHDVLTVEPDMEVSGRIIRLVDRGVIMRRLKDGRVTFVPKERIVRIDQNVPADDDEDLHVVRPKSAPGKAGR
jgi:hypothetical protein